MVEMYFVLYLFCWFVLLLGMMVMMIGVYT
jgi:hypothetical protein